MADYLDDAWRLLVEHRARDREAAAERGREGEAAGREERRVAAWLDRPEWISYWDDAAGAFTVPDGWPPCAEPDHGAPDTAPAHDTAMHRMFRSKQP